MVRLCGAALGFLAFGVTVFLGLGSGLTPETILVRAIWAMILFCILGLLTGWVAYRILDEHAIKMNRELFQEIEEEQEAAEAKAAADAQAVEGVPNQSMPGQEQKKPARTPEPAEVAAGT